MKKTITALAVLALVSAAPAAAQNANMTFFITSAGSGDGANLGGLAGADQRCEDLAYPRGFGDLTWHAYLSALARNGQPAVNARDRIGSGPWAADWMLRGSGKFSDQALGHIECSSVAALLDVVKMR